MIDGMCTDDLLASVNISFEYITLLSIEPYNR